MDFNSMKDQLKEKGKTELNDEVETVKKDLADKFGDKLGFGEKRLQETKEQEKPVLSGTNAESNPADENNRNVIDDVPAQSAKAAVESDEKVNGVEDDVEDSEDEDKVA